MLIRLLLTAALSLPFLGWLVKWPAPDPNKRILELQNQSDGGQIEAEVERFWTIDQPSHLTPSEAEAAIRRKLLSPVTLNFEDTPLKQVIDDMRDYSNINIVPDLPAIRRAGISLETPITIKLNCVSCNSALTLVLHQARLAHQVRGEVLLVTTEDEARGRAAVTVAVANVRREEVSLFRVEGGELKFVQKVPAGEAVDVKAEAGEKLAATFASAPHCANFTVKETEGQVWLLRTTAPQCPKAAQTSLSREGKRRNTDYIIEPPDVLRVEARLESPAGMKQMRDDYLVRPDGTISLSGEGVVPVAGMTLATAEAKIVDRLRKRYARLEVRVGVQACNSKWFYVITDGGSGAEVTRHPCAGKETVRDAIRSISGLAALATKNKVYLQRPAASPDDLSPMYPVDWTAIVKSGDMATNYRLRPGDRIHIVNPLESPGLAVVPPLYQRVLDCLRDWLYPDPNRRILELINQSEDLRQIELEMERFWMLDQPANSRPDRVHGGVGPSD
jgi:protein involved in polysaccharide export with SLBB domain